MPDFAAAAAQLGITEEALMAALGDPSQGQPDMAAADATLGVTEEALMEAMGEPGKQPEFAAAAALDVTAEELEAVLMDSSGAP